MKKLNLFFLLLCLLFSVGVRAGNPELFKKKGFTLQFINQDEALNLQVKARLVETFFKVYPKLVKEYNRNAAKEVVFIVDTAYKGVAYASGGKITFSSRWLKTHPEDIDVVTHEAMHVVQNYRNSGAPGWLTEGIADYVRYKFGVDNAGAGWTMPELKPSHSYESSYRITARFLAWLEKNGSKGIVKELDSIIRSRNYKEEFWTDYTGNSLEDLWKRYADNPVL